MSRLEEPTPPVSTDQARSLPQVLVINPKQNLLIKGSSSHSANVTITLTNPANKLVAFKVKTTAPKRYCVRPNGGLIKPAESVTVNIVYQPGDNNDAQERAKHKFLVQAIFAENEQISLDQMWRDVPKDKLMESKIRCVFEDTDGDSAQVEPRLPDGSVLAAAGTDRTTGPAVDMDQTVVRNFAAHPDAGGVGQKEIELRRLAEDYRRAQDEIATVRDENRRLREQAERMRKSISTIGSSTSTTGAAAGAGSRQEVAVDWKNDLTKLHTLGAIIGALVIGIILSQIIF